MELTPEAAVCTPVRTLRDGSVVVRKQRPGPIMLEASRSNSLDERTTLSTPKSVLTSFFDF